MAGLDQVAQRVARRTYLTIPKAKELAAEVLVAIEEIVNEGDIVTIKGFGRFFNKTTAARMGTHPGTGAPVEIPSKTKMVFKRSPNA